MKKQVKIWQKTKTIFQDHKNVALLLESIVSAIDKNTENIKDWKSFKKKLSTLVRMGKAHLSGEYKAFSNRSFFLLVFALFYFITPIDSIPDFLPALGFTDDISVVYFVFKQIANDITLFTKWENKLNPLQ